MRILYLRGAFLLPDDFEGTESEALKVFAKHYELFQSGKLDIKPIEGEAQEIPDKLWEDFLTTLEEGRQMYMEIFCGKLINGKWIRFKSM